jgi:hypothetical protein
MNHSIVSELDSKRDVLSNFVNMFDFVGRGELELWFDTLDKCQVLVGKLEKRL